MSQDDLRQDNRENEQVRVVLNTSPATTSITFNLKQDTCSCCCHEVSPNIVAGNSVGGSVLERAYKLLVMPRELERYALLLDGKEV